jgi:signal transduction histidine kinase
LFILSFKNSETVDKKWSLAGQALLLMFAAGLTLFEHSFHARLLKPDTWGHLDWYIALVFSITFLFATAFFIRDTSKNLFWLVAAFIFTGVTVAVSEKLLPLSIPKIQINQFLLVDQTNVGGVLCGLISGIFMLSSLLNLNRSYQVTVYALHRNRYKYWYVVWISTLIAAVMFLVRQPGIGFIVLILDGVLSVFISTTHELPDIRQILRKSVGFLFFTLFAIVVYSAAYWLLFEVTLNTTYSSRLIGIVILATILVLVANPIIAITQNWIHRLVSGRGFNSSKLLGEYSKKISSLLELDQLAAEIIALITHDLHISYGEIFIVIPSEGGFILRKVNRKGQESDFTQRVLRLKEDSPLASFFNQENEPITQYDIDLLPKFHAMASEEKEWINSFKMDVYMPVSSQNEWIGLLALGPKASGDRYFDDEITLLRALANQTAIALRNARLYEDLRNRNLENERLNNDLTSANQELSRLDQAKSDFISIASHEIRTPLTQIIGYNDIMTDMVKGDNIQRSAGLQMVDGVRKAAKRLEEIVDTMFDVSKLDTRTLDLEFLDIHIAAVISNAADRWRMAVEDRRQTLLIKGLSTLPVIRGDERRLTQVFSNLIQNAIKYTPDGGEIRITARSIIPVSQEECPGLEVIIKDTGIGIAIDDLDKVFEKFYRVGNVMLHSSGETKFKGAGPGLGLTIARGIVEAHHGKIWAESLDHDEERFPGTAFHVVLPLTQPEDTTK